MNKIAALILLGYSSIFACLVENWGNLVIGTAFNGGNLMSAVQAKNPKAVLLSTNGGDWAGIYAVMYDVVVMIDTCVDPCGMLKCINSYAVPAGCTGYQNVGGTYFGYTPPSGCTGNDNDTSCNNSPVDSSNCASQNGDSIVNVVCYEYEKGAAPGGGTWVILNITKKGCWNAETNHQDNTNSIKQLNVMGGCAGVTPQMVGGEWPQGHDSLVVGNTRDSSTIVDGVHRDSCYQGGVMVEGKCIDNGLTPGSIPTNGNNTLNEGPGIGPGDTNTTRTDTLSHNNGSDTALLTKAVYGDGVNRLLYAVDSTTAAAVTANGLLTRIANSAMGLATMTRAYYDTSKGGGGGNSPDTGGNGLRFDSGAVSRDSSMFAGFDTGLAGVGMAVPDSSDLLRSLRAKLDSSDSQLSTDTEIVVPDSTSFKQFFSAFELNWGDTSGCECDSSAFSFNVFRGVVNVNMCKYDISVFTKPIFMLMAAIALFLFYRAFVFKVLMKMDAFLP